MKSNWKEPFVNELDLNDTKEGNIEELSRPEYPCRYGCGKTFINTSDKNKHEKKCFNKPADKGPGDQPVIIPGLDEMPLS